MKISRHFLDVARAVLLPFFFSSVTSRANTDEASAPQAEGRYRLVITVISADRNEAIAGATVKAVFHYSSNPGEVALEHKEKTGDDGRAYLIYDFTGNRWEPYHRWDVTISHPDFVEADRVVPITKNRLSGDIPIRISLKRRSGTKVVTVKVIAADDHAPIIDARVALRGRRKLTAMYDASTDRDGRAVINVTESDDYEVTVSHSGFMDVERTLTVKVLDDEPQTYHLDLQMRRPGEREIPSPTPTPETKEEATATPTPRASPSPSPTPSPTPSPSPSPTPSPTLSPSPSVTASPGADDVIVPDLSTFQSVTEIKAVLAHAGLKAVLVAAKEKPPSKDKEFKFAGQEPAPDTKLKKGSTVTIAFYEKFESAEAAGTPGGFTGIWKGQFTMRTGKSTQTAAGSLTISRQGNGYAVHMTGDTKPFTGNIQGAKLIATRLNTGGDMGGGFSMKGTFTERFEGELKGESLHFTMVIFSWGEITATGVLQRE